MSTLRIVAQYDRPRYAIQKMNYSTAEGKVAGESEWETVLTEQEEFKAKLKAEAPGLTAAELVKNCREEMKSIRWENAAAQLMTIYRDALGGH